MKRTQLIHDPYHNPFHNRFHFPVHSRIDEMQAYTKMIWLNEPASDSQAEENQHSRHWTSALAGAFAVMLLVIFSATFL